MEPTTVIRRPLITEKTTYASGETNRYAFEVDRRADKAQIRRAVEALYGVKVTAVTVQIRAGKLRRYRYGYVLSAPTRTTARLVGALCTYP